MSRRNLRIFYISIFFISKIMLHNQKFIEPYTFFVANILVYIGKKWIFREQNYDKAHPTIK